MSLHRIRRTRRPLRSAPSYAATPTAPRFRPPASTVHDVDTELRAALRHQI